MNELKSEKKTFKDNSTVIWKKARLDLRRQLTEGSCNLEDLYVAWIEPLTVIGIKQKSIFMLNSPNEISQKFVKQHYLSCILDRVSTYDKNIKEVIIVCD